MTSSLNPPALTQAATDPRSLRKRVLARFRMRSAVGTLGVDSAGLCRFRSPWFEGAFRV